MPRYADTNGYPYDPEQEQWVWRDWVIRPKRAYRLTIHDRATRRRFALM